MKWDSNKSFVFIFRFLPKRDLVSVSDILGDVELSLGGYFSYPGSLTRPPCLNTVTWVVSTQKIKVSKILVRTKMSLNKE